MQQQIQISRRPEQVLNDAASFFAKRRAKVTDRTERGFRFGLQGSSAQDGGRVSVAPGAGGVCTVTVQADGLGVMAIAEGFVRELRKQARDQGRTAQRGQRTDAGPMRGDFSGLRERLGMPPERPFRPAPRPAPPPPTRADSVESAQTPAESPGIVPMPGTATAPVSVEANTSGGVAATPEGAAGGQPVDAPSVSAEQTGGVPAPDEVQVGASPETAKAHSGAGSPHVPPALDPSVPPSSVRSL